ncbi:hypothetical protein MKX01_025913 [Papaver californicum]|nr:hypothetical protein MKX01_025913 [Papaver californicum]
MDHDPHHRVGEKSNPLLSVSLTTCISLPKGGECHSSDTPGPRFRNANMKDPDRGLIEAFDKIGAMSERLGIVSTIKDLANEIYKKMEDMKQSHKRMNKDAVVAACLYIACERLKNPRRIKEICWFANGVSEKNLGRAVKEVNKILDTRSGDGGLSINGGDFLKRFCSDLGMSNKAVNAAQEAVEKTAEPEIDIRRAPITVAASIIYMIAQLSGDDRKQKIIQDVADATGVSQNTIKKSYKDIYPYASRLVPDWYANKEDLRKLCRP